MDAHIDAMTALPADVADENATRTCAATNSMVHNLSDSETLEDGEVMAMNEIEANAIVETQVLASGSSVCMHNSKQHMSPVLVTDAMQQQQQSTPTLIMSDLQIALSAAISTTGTCAVPDEPSIPSRNALKTLEDIACSSTVKVMATVATDSDESDSSDSSMSSVSDSTSTDSAHSELDVRRRVLDDVDIDEDENGTSSKEAPRTKNELVQPMVKKPDIVRVPDGHDLVEVGRVHAVVGTVVVVESALITGAESGDGSSNDALPRPIARPVTAALDAGSIVAFADRTVLGEVVVGELVY